MQQCTYFVEPQEALKMDRPRQRPGGRGGREHPDRLVGLGSVPLHDVALAAQELERCVRDLKLRGVIISSHVNGVELGDERFRPFWAKAEELGAVIFIHPAGNTDPRMKKQSADDHGGQPLEEAYALSSLVYEGVMDQFPKLKILVAHGGGYLPFYTGRHDNDYRYGRAPHLKGDFSSYLPRFFYDTVLFNPDMLEFLATKVPVSHLMLASDYPFAEKQPVEYVRRAKRIGRRIRTRSWAPMRRGCSGSRSDAHGRGADYTARGAPPMADVEIVLHPIRARTAGPTSSCSGPTASSGSARAARRRSGG